MRTIDLVDKLYQSGDMRALIQAGLISINMFTWRKIYKTYEDRLASGRGPYQAGNDAADTHNISYKTVTRVVKKMEYEIK